MRVLLLTLLAPRHEAREMFGQCVMRPLLLNALPMGHQRPAANVWQSTRHCMPEPAGFAVQSCHLNPAVEQEMNTLLP